jgi:hypothetical protein
VMISIRVVSFDIGACLGVSLEQNPINLVRILLR